MDEGWSIEWGWVEQAAHQAYFPPVNSITHAATGRPLLHTATCDSAHARLFRGKKRLCGASAGGRLREASGGFGERTQVETNAAILPWSGAGVAGAERHFRSAVLPSTFDRQPVPPLRPPRTDTANERYP